MVKYYVILCGSHVKCATHVTNCREVQDERYDGHGQCHSAVYIDGGHFLFYAVASAEAGAEETVRDVGFAEAR